MGSNRYLIALLFSVVLLSGCSYTTSMESDNKDVEIEQILLENEILLKENKLLMSKNKKLANSYDELLKDYTDIRKQIDNYEYRLNNGSSTKKGDLDFDYIEVLDDDIPIIKLSDIRIEKEYKLDNHVFYQYSKDDMYWIAISIKDITYNIGEISFLKDSISLEKVMLGDIEYIRIEGGLGAAYPIVYYLYINDDKPKYKINKELPITTVDLDNDGSDEWISQYGGMTKIYYENEGKWGYIDLNQLLNYVYLNENKNLIESVTCKENQGKTIDTYRFCSGKLSKVQ